MRLIIIGPVGSGKSTQGEFLSKHFHLPYIATGDIFREMAKGDTELDKKIRHSMETGTLVPDSDTVALVTSFLKDPRFANGYVLDGFPRTLPQAEVFTEQIDFVIDLDVSDEEIVKRLHIRRLGRTDDQPDIIKKRIAIYHEQTKPLSDFYQQMGILLKIDGERPIPEISHDIISRIESHL